jgi:hypothetical protein
VNSDTFVLAVIGQFGLIGGMITLAVVLAGIVAVQRTIRSEVQEGVWFLVSLFSVIGIVMLPFRLDAIMRIGNSSWCLALLPVMASVHALARCLADRETRPICMWAKTPRDKGWLA